MIRFPLQAKPRKLKGVLIGPGSGPAERIKYLQKVVTQLIRDERIEGREDKMDEARGYAEQLLNLAIQNGDRHKPTMDMADKWLLLLNLAIQNGDRHKPTMDMADKWLLEKDLVHKLFKVLAPRYSNYNEAFTNIHRLPAKYPGQGKFQAILELKGNPYPPVIPKQYNKDSFIVNVLIQSAKDREARGKERAERRRMNNNATGRLFDENTAEEGVGSESWVKNSFMAIETERRAKGGFMVNKAKKQVENDLMMNEAERKAENSFIFNEAEGKVEDGLNGSESAKQVTDGLTANEVELERKVEDGLSMNVTEKQVEDGLNASEAERKAENSFISNEVEKQAENSFITNDTEKQVADGLIANEAEKQVEQLDETKSDKPKDSDGTRS